MSTKLYFKFQMRFYYKLIVGIFFIVPAVLCLENESEDRKEKLSKSSTLYTIF